ncbi:competence ComEA-like helix-hairpin-helix protein [Mucilaginibacter gracilis]|uniref:Competence ComEA-like helix-hairpin-helix protein n=1 Tax=Mucilaginibacter gracilis TaxID=423350 RepID=A0A495J0S4_9SPHI|nr:helix-hairpin-helix domain-containing protein [Mucilaginibacter gracilis]RKR82221.1 competence ComEA-like helix-hairpin-helix protein [Mucilaginibacter gracilis]
MIRAFKNYFAITKKEWNGMVVLMLIIALVLVIPFILPYFHQDKPMDVTGFKKALAQLKSAKGGNPNGTSVFNSDDDKKDPHPILFKFNPNGLADEQWKKLGLSQHQINGIKNYEAKGGHFYTRADVKKMYTITADDYTRIEAYIDLPAGETFAKKGDIIIEINTADSAHLTQLRGIGPSFAARIVSYRRQLGGFAYKGQLKEVYGIDSAKYNQLAKQITVNPKKIVKIDINHVVVDDLRRFPYLNFKQMNAIVEYRKQHGNYQSITDLHDIALLDDEILRKIAPYLKFK